MMLEIAIKAIKDRPFISIDPAQVDAIIIPKVEEFKQGQDEEQQQYNPIVQHNDTRFQVFNQEIKTGDNCYYVAFDLRAQQQVDLIIKTEDDVNRLFDLVIQPTLQYVKSRFMVQPSAILLDLFSDVGQPIASGAYKQQTMEQAQEDLKYNLLDVMDRYEKQDMFGYSWLGAEIRVLVVRYITNPQQLIGGVYQAIELANKKFLIIDTASRTNCVFNSLFMCMRLQKVMKKTERTQLELQSLYKMLTDEDNRKEYLLVCKKRAIFTKDYNNRMVSIIDIDDITRDLQVNCIVYNNIFEKVRIITHNEEYPTAEIQIHNGVHCLPLLRWKDISKIYPDKIDDLIKKYGLDRSGRKSEPEEQIEQEPKKLQMIQPKKVTKNKDLKIATWDLETYTIKERPNIYLSGLSWLKSPLQIEEEIEMNQHDTIYHFVQFDTDNNNLQQFWQYIKDRIKLFNGYIFYAHCGGRFDLNLLIRDVINKDNDVFVDQSKTCELNGSWLTFGIHINDCYIEFRDSYKLFQAKLEDVTKSFCQKNFKTELDHNLINRLITQMSEILGTDYNIISDIYNRSQDGQELSETEVQIMEFMSKAVPYHKLDCISLLEALNNFNLKFIELYNMDILNGRSISGLAKKFFLSQLYNPKSCPLFKLTPELDEYIRKTYRGGMNNCFKFGILNGRIYYYDFNSHFPAVGCLILPYGKPVYKRFGETTHKCCDISTKMGSYNVMGLDKDQNIEKWGDSETDQHKCGCYKGQVADKQFFASIGKYGGFFEVLVRGTKEMLKCQNPYISVRNKEGVLDYPFIDNTHIVSLTMPEIQYCVQQGYEITVLSGQLLSMSSYLRSQFTKLYEQKKEARQKGDTCMENLSKIMINSGYGWFGLNTNNKDQVIFTPKASNEYLKYLGEERLLAITEWANDRVLRVISKCASVDCSVGVASYITAYARIKLHQLITDIQKKPLIDPDTKEPIMIQNEQGEMVQQYGEVYYVDTDSVITNLKLSDYPDLIKKYRPDYLESTAMGSLKNELGMTDKGEDLAYDQSYFVGCKNYAMLHKCDPQNNEEHSKHNGVCKKKSEVYKLKGFKQRDSNIPLNLDVFKKLANGETITQKAPQISCPKSSYVRDNIMIDGTSQEAFQMIIKDVEKKFKMLTNKGIIQDDGWLKPNTY